MQCGIRVCVRVHVRVFQEPSPIMIAGAQTPHFGLYIKYVNVVWLRQSQASIEVDS